MIKRETVNSIFAGLALLISCLAYFDQIWRKPDDLMIEGRRVRNENIAIAAYEDNNYDEHGVGHPIIGPTAFHIQIFNPMERTISITDWDVYALQNNETDWYYGMDARLSGVANKERIPVPFEIPPGEVRVYWFSLFIPMIATDEQKRNCLKEILLIDVEECFLRFGSDIFGNKIGDEEFYNANIHRTRMSSSDGPSYQLTFKTGDGTSETILLNYYN